MPDVNVKGSADLSQIHTQLKLTNQYLLTMANRMMAVQSIMSRGFTPAIQKGATGLNKTAAATKNTTKGLSNMQSQLKGVAMRFVGLQAILAFAIGQFRKLHQWVKESIDASREFNEAIAEVSTILQNDANLRIYEFREGIEELSKSFGKGAVDLTNGMYDILSAAVDASEAFDLLVISTRVAVAGLSEVDTAVDITTSILNAYGKSVYQMASVSDELFQAVVRGKFHFEDLAHSLGYIVPIAANLGVEFREILAALMTVTRQGQHVDMATRGLALGIQNIADITPQAAEAAREYGVDLSATALQVGGLQYILEQLSEATEKYGGVALPKMIRNVRSLRVFMALLGDEGLKGYKDDMDALAESTGQTSKAMTQMRATTKMEADIMEQTMAELERKIGDAWHDTAIWWEKAKLWWGTFFSGGEATKAVKDMETQIKNIKKAYWDLLKVQFDLEEQGTIFDMIMGDTTQDIGSILEGKINFGDIAKYFDTEKSMHKIAGLQASLGMIPDTLNDIADSGYYFGLSTTEMVSTIAEINKYIKEYNSQLDDSSKKIELVSDKYKMWEGNITKIIDSAENALAKMNVELAENAGHMETLSKNKMIFGETRTYLLGAAGDFTEAIDTYQSNIMQLESDLKTLRDELIDTYKTMGGTTFTGKMAWQTATFGIETAFDRFKHYAEMTINYGDEMSTSFMGSFADAPASYVDEWGKSLGKVSPYLEWYNKEMWESVQTNQGYKGSLIDAISEMSAFEEQERKTTKATNEHNLAIKENTLLIMQLQLKGMESRHGLRRGDLNKIQKLEILNMKERIEMMKEDVDQSIIQIGSIDEVKSAYDEYVDRVTFKIWELKDVRNSEVMAMLEDMSLKEKRLGTYGDMLIENINNYEDTWIRYYQFLGTIADNISPELYEDLFGLSYGDMITDLEKNNERFRKLWLDNGTQSYQSGSEGTGSGNGSVYKTPRTQPSEEPKTYRVETTGWVKKDDLNWGWVKSSSGMKKTDLYNAVSGWNVKEWLNSNYPHGSILNWRRGSEYIPKDMLAMLHKGETVTPNGRQTGTSKIQITVDPMTVNSIIRDQTDLKTFGNKVGQAIAAGFVSGVESEFEVG